MDIESEKNPQEIIHQNHHWKPALFLLMVIAVGAISYAFYQSKNLAVDLSRGDASGGGLATLSLNPVSPTINAGQTLTMGVTLDTGGLSVTAVELVISFPAGTIRADSIAKGSGLPNGIELVAGSVTSTQARITLGSGTTPVNGNNILVAVLQVTALQEGTVNVQIDSSSQVAAVNHSVNVLGTRNGATIVVTSPPPTVTLTANGYHNSVTLPPNGDRGTLSFSWSSTNATSCTASKTGDNQWVTGEVSINQSDYQPWGAAGNTGGTYTITCTGSGGSYSASVVVIAEAPPTALFSSDRYNIKTGLQVPEYMRSALLLWSTGSGIQVNISSLPEITGISGTHTVSPTATTTYTLTATNAVGTFTNSITIEVGKLGDIVAPLGTIDIFDYNQLIADFGGPESSLANIDERNGVTIFDYNLLVANFGR